MPVRRTRSCVCRFRRHWSALSRSPLPVRAHRRGGRASCHDARPRPAMLWQGPLMRARRPARRTRRITRRRLRTVVGRTPRLFPEPGILHAQAADFFLQRGQPFSHVHDYLLDTGRRALPVFRSDHGVGANERCRFHKPEITKSGVALHSVSSTPVNGYKPST